MKNNIFIRNRKFKQFILGTIFIIIIILGWFFPYIGYFIPACMVVGIVISLFYGRKWCDWYCPRGSFYDTYINIFSKRIKIPLFIRTIKFRIFILVLLMIALSSQIFLIGKSLESIGFIFIKILTITTIIGIIFGIIFQERFWCFLCPVGTLSNLFGRWKKPLQINSQTCIDCKLCEKVCPMQIAPYKYKKENIETVFDADCLKCESCVSVCPKKSLFLKKDN